MKVFVSPRASTTGAPPVSRGEPFRDLSSGDGGVSFVERPDQRGRQKESLNLFLVRFFAEADKIVQHRGDDSRRSVGRRRHDAATRRVLFVDGQRVEIHPVQDRHRVAEFLAGVTLKHTKHLRRSSLDTQTARQNAFVSNPPLNAILHRLPDQPQPVADLRVGSKCSLVLARDLAHRNPLPISDLEQFTT